MPNTVGGVIVDPNDKTIVVTIVNAVTGTTPTLYTAKNGVVTVASPATITTKTEFHLVSEGTYTVSATTNGVACIGFPETVFIGSGGITTLAPEVDPDLYDASLITLAAGKAQVLAAVDKTASFTFASGDLAMIDTTSGAVVGTLPTTPADKTRCVAKWTAGANAASVAAGGSAHFNTTAGGTTASLALLNQSTQFQYRASNDTWIITANDLPLSTLDTRFAPTAQGFLEGSGTPSGSLGANGQMYWDYTNKTIYGPKAAGVWPAGVALLGETISVSNNLRGDTVPQPFNNRYGAGSRSLGTAGRIYLIRYVPTRARALALAAWNVTTAATVNDPVEVGLYTVGATTLSRVATTGSQTSKLNAVGVASATLSYAADPSTVYYVALTNATIGGTGATLYAATGGDNYAAELYGTVPPTVSFGTIDSVLSGGLLPTSITISSVLWGHNSGQNVIPQIALREV